MTVRNLLPGDPAPRFRAPVIGSSPNFVFDTMGGRVILMLFAGSAGWAPCRAALEALERHRALLDDEAACFFGVTIDPEDIPARRVGTRLPGMRWFDDKDRTVSRLYGAMTDEDGQERYHPHWVLIDPLMRIVRRLPVERSDEMMASLVDQIGRGFETPTAPVLVIPRVLDPQTCRDLIAVHQMTGGEDSGFMRDVDGVTRMQIDHRFKRRSDQLLPEGPLLERVKARLKRFLMPQIMAAFQFEVTRVERWLVACYDGDEGGGHFRAHRDNTTHGTAHRKFACTINLNAEDYEGGDLRFPEFGPKSYRTPTGGATVFSCSLLHEAMPVTRGRRYALLPFFYDDAGARTRERNLGSVSEDLQHYRSGLPPEAA